MLQVGIGSPHKLGAGAALAEAGIGGHHGPEEGGVVGSEVLHEGCERAAGVVEGEVLAHVEREFLQARQGHILRVEVVGAEKRAGLSITAVLEINN